MFIQYLQALVTLVLALIEFMPVWLLVTVIFGSIGYLLGTLKKRAKL